MSASETYRTMPSRPRLFAAGGLLTGSLLVPGVATAAGANFDTVRYCRTVAAHAGGSYQTEEACRQQEAESRQEIAELQIEARIERHCRQVGAAIGGSYQIMASCIDQELAAKSRLRGR